ncbi:hypothetical protein M3Y95_00066000 [Aphelenchoides besseyi]|nr:hypothetical protein M3Y95_00066000 [Aphelenchoides besseyi]
MESRTSNLTAEICRHGDYRLGLARAFNYTNARHVPALRPSLIRHPEHFLIVCGQICVKYPEDRGYIYYDDSARYFDPDFRFRRF